MFNSTLQTIYLTHFSPSLKKYPSISKLLARWQWNCGKFEVFKDFSKVPFSYRWKKLKFKENIGENKIYGAFTTCSIFA